MLAAVPPVFVMCTTVSNHCPSDTLAWDIVSVVDRLARSGTPDNAHEYVPPPSFAQTLTVQNPATLAVYDRACAAPTPALTLDARRLSEGS